MLLPTWVSVPERYDDRDTIQINVIDAGAEVQHLPSHDTISGGSLSFLFDRDRGGEGLSSALHGSLHQYLRFSGPGWFEEIIRGSSQDQRLHRTRLHLYNPWE